MPWAQRKSLSLVSGLLWQSSLGSSVSRHCETLNCGANHQQIKRKKKILNVKSSQDRNKKAVKSWHHLSHATPVLHFGVIQSSVLLPAFSTRRGRPEGGDHKGKCTNRIFQKGPSVWFLLPATACEMQIWATQSQEICFTMLMVSSVLLKSYCDPWLGTVGHNYWRSFLESNFISTQYWPASAWKVNGKTHSDFNERRSRSVLENLMHSLYILSLIPCDPQRKRNNSESPRAKQRSFAAQAEVLLPL